MLHCLNATIRLSIWSNHMTEIQSKNKAEQHYSSLLKRKQCSSIFVRANFQQDYDRW